MMFEHILVAGSEGEDEEALELPTEDDSTLLLSTLSAQFPGACGLKYRNPSSTTMRGVKLSDGRFYPPANSSWSDQIHYCVFPKVAESKRKSDVALENSSIKSKKIDTQLKRTDLIVLGLPWSITEDDLKRSFESIGEILMTEVKKDPKTGQSRGFGFIRFATYESQLKALSSRHLIGGRWCEVKLPNSKGGLLQLSSKVFIGRCTEDLTADDLKDYFGKFGEIVDVYIPKPFRAFSFITFLDHKVAERLCGEDHIVKGTSVYVSSAEPKSSGHGSKNSKNISTAVNRSDVAGMHQQKYGSEFNQNIWSSNQRPRSSNATPNLQFSGSSQQGGNQQGGNNPLGFGHHYGGFAMNPAFLAATLNQAGWNLINNMQNQPEPVQAFNNVRNMNIGGNNSNGGNQGSSNNQRDRKWMNQGQQENQWANDVPVLRKQQEKGFLKYE